MTPPNPSTTVYSWYMPEIRKLVDTYAKERYPSEIYRRNFDPGLDKLHERLTESYRFFSLQSVFADTLTWDEHLPHSYYCNGSSEALFHLLARHKTVYPHVPLYQSSGEYQGYNEYANAVGLQFHNVQFGEDVLDLPRGLFFLSVPSAVDGNGVQRSVIERITQKHAVVIDCAYAGMTPGQCGLLPLNENIVAVVGSMSKPFGLYYYRIGFAWTRDPVLSLYGNKWFKNVWSIQVGDEVFEEYSAQYFAYKYRPWQTRACAEASTLLGVEVKPSDVWLLGHVLPNAQDSLPMSLGPFKRGPGYRICLTPYYMAYEREDDAS